MTKYLITLIAFLLLYTSNTLAQRKLQQLDEEEASKQKQVEDTYGKANNGERKWVFGGNVSFGLSSISSLFLIQPIAGYKVKPNTIVGGGATYIYSSFTYFGKKYATSVYGPLVFARQNIFESFFAQIEYQPINYEFYDLGSTNNSPSRVWFQQLFVGGGYGTIPGAYIGVYYNVLFQTNQLYNNPLDIRVGFFF